MLSNQIKELTINIQHFVRTDTNDKDLTQLEEKVEEYVYEDLQTLIKELIDSTHLGYI